MTLPRPLSFLAAVACWTVLGVLNAGQIYLRQSYVSDPISIYESLGRMLPLYWIWAALAPLVWMACRRFDLGSRMHWRPLAGHAASALGLSLLHTVIYAPVVLILVWPDELPRVWHVVAKNLGYNTVFNIVIYAAVAGVYYSLRYLRSFRQRELETSLLALRASRLESDLANARLDTLRVQLQPHFIFNALNAISTLVVTGDARRAGQVLDVFSDLLRRLLSARVTPETPLASELDFTRRYLEIEHARFGDRFAVEYDIGANTLDLAIPTLALQPLVENAVRHGMSRVKGGGRIRITSRCTRGRLVLRVSDNGAAHLSRSGTDLTSPGLGLANTRARLLGLYGDTATLHFRRIAGVGAVASLQIPARESAALS